MCDGDANSSDQREQLEQEMHKALTSSEWGYTRLAHYVSSLLSTDTFKGEWAVEILISWLDREDLKEPTPLGRPRDLRIGVLEVIRHLELRQAVSKLLDYARKGTFEYDEWLQSALVDVLKDLSVKEAVPFIIQQLSKYDVAAESAAVALARLDPAEALRRIRQLVAIARNAVTGQWLYIVIARLLAAEGRSVLSKITYEFVNAEVEEKRLVLEAIAEATNPECYLKTGLSRQESEEAVEQAKRQLRLR